MILVESDHAGAGTLRSSRPAPCPTNVAATTLAGGLGNAWIGRKYADRRATAFLLAATDLPYVDGLGVQISSEFGWVSPTSVDGLGEWDRWARSRVLRA